MVLKRTGAQVPVLGPAVILPLSPAGDFLLDFFETSDWFTTASQTPSDEFQGVNTAIRDFAFVDVRRGLLKKVSQGPLR
jgi:hypothetical protein